MFNTSDTVLRPDWKLVGFITVLILDVLILIYLGINLGENMQRDAECIPCGANLEDMEYLVSELRKCKKAQGDLTW